MDNDKSGHRYMILPITDMELLNLFSHFSEINGIQRIQLPEDAKVVTVHHDPCTKEWLIFLESEKFNIIKEGREIPKLEFTNEMVRKSKIVEV